MIAIANFDAFHDVDVMDFDELWVYQIATTANDPTGRTIPNLLHTAASHTSSSGRES
jgi:hypothetical protein